MYSSPGNFVSTHAIGQVYRPATGRAAEREAIEDHRSNNRSVIKGTPSPDEFLTIIRRELRIRFYQRNTAKSYMQGLTALQRERIESPVFFDYLRVLLGARFLQSNANF